VLLQRVASSAPAGVHDYLYEVDRIGKARTGEISLDLIHFPIDALGRSLVALDVMAAVGGGVLLSTGKSGTSCDVNADDDETVPADDSLDPDDWTLPDDDAFDVEIPDSDFGSGGEFDGGSEGSEGSEGDNPPEDLDPQELPQIGGASPGGPIPGDILTPPDCAPGCLSLEVRWYENGELVQENPDAPFFVAGIQQSGGTLEAEVYCAEYGTPPVCRSEPLPIPAYEDVSGVDRPISASWTLTTVSFPGNHCETGAPAGTPGTSTSAGSHSGTGVGYRVTRGSVFASQICGTVSSSETIPDSGILIELVKQDGSTSVAYSSGASGRITVSPADLFSYFSGFVTTGVTSLTVTG